jgi:GrpB-like predicted nucleotidyltransferase (UPF0157 family)
MGRSVRVVPYDPRWRTQFEEEAGVMAGVFGAKLVDVHHFGSTAVEGMWAKPIVDLMVVVEVIETADALTPQLEAIGYTAQGEYGIAGRRFFFKGSYNERSHHLHVYAVGNEQIDRHLAFRDYMRAHPALADEYSELKRQLAYCYPQDMDSYIAGKHEFIQQHERLAMDWWRG